MFGKEFLAWMDEWKLFTKNHNPDIYLAQSGEADKLQLSPGFPRARGGSGGGGLRGAAYLIPKDSTRMIFSDLEGSTRL